jgi:hypothetical protein
MLSIRLSNVQDGLSQLARKSLEGINRAGSGEALYEQMRMHLDTLVTFSMQFAIANTLRPEQAHAVLENLHFWSGPELKVFEERFAALDPQKFRLSRASAEYMLAGLAFQELCGDMGHRDINNGVRQFGAELFAKMFTH